MNASQRDGKTALICGIAGQDGGYLAAHLLGHGYTVIGIHDRVRVQSM
jgi:GDP-D-mannose dehydratase